MHILIAGGNGFLGGALRRALTGQGHSVKILTRSAVHDVSAVSWDGVRVGSWIGELERADVVVNACGLGLHHWPWTAARKLQFLESRVVPGQALSAAFAVANPRPRTLIQFSGINRYGLTGDGVADEETPAGGDFLAQLTVEWEDSTRAVEGLGVRRIVVRNGVVLDARSGLYPLMCLPARFFVGGRLGDGTQMMPWIHVADHVRALVFLIEREEAAGAFNLVAPEGTNNVELMRSTCAELRRPYWFHVPSAMLRLALGEMADLVLHGRASAPHRLLQAGFQFRYPDIQSAAHNLLRGVGA